MIAPSAVKRFLNRPLRDSAKAKRWSPKKIKRMLRQAGAEFHTQPRGDWQRVCFLLGLRHPGYLFLLEQGLGKTWLALNLFMHHKRTVGGENFRGLVLVPFGANVPQWIREAKKHAPHLRVLGVAGDREQRQEVLDSDADLIVCTYMGWLRLVCDLQDVVDRAGRRTGKQRLRVNKKLIAKLYPTFPFVAYDECSFLGNRQSTSWKVLRPFLKHASFRYGLTGTPFGMYPEDLWAQFYLCDGGDTLGPTLGLYRGAFFIEKKRHFGFGFDYKFDERKKAALHRMLRHGSVRYAEKECFELPPLVRSRLPVTWTDEAWAYYEGLLKRFQRAHDRDDRQGQENTWMRLRQLSSGYITAKGERGERVQIDFDENPKLDLLVAKLKELPPGRKAVVYCDFVHSGDVLSRRLKAEKINHVRLYSGTKKKVKDTLEERFAGDAKLRVLVTSQAGAFGLNLQAANYVYVYEPPVSPIIYKQFIKRCHRQGQTRRVFLTQLYVKNSVEQRIFGSLARGEDLFQALVDGKVRAKDLLWRVQTRKSK